MAAVLDYSEREVWTGSRWEPTAELRRELREARRLLDLVRELRIVQRRWGHCSIDSETGRSALAEVRRLADAVDGQLGLLPSDGF
jgi:hypothetical protein